MVIPTGAISKSILAKAAANDNVPTEEQKPLCGSIGKVASGTEVVTFVGIRVGCPSE